MNKILISLLLASLLNALTFTEFISPFVDLREDGKIFIPNHIKHVKLDIGLSYSAPFSQYWITHEDDLIVFGFEPNPGAIKQILEGAKKQHPLHGDPLDPAFIGKHFFLIPCALSNRSHQSLPFYVTEVDCGCSSLYKPKFFAVEQVVQVPVFKLSDFFSLFPFDTHPIIEYIKIDAQGSDLEIIKGAESYLTDRVVFVTLEAEDSQYENTNNTEWLINSYMKKVGFIPVYTEDTSDPTFINSKFIEYARSHKIQIYQRG